MNLRNDVQHLRRENEFLRQQLEAPRSISPTSRMGAPTREGAASKLGSPKSAARLSPQPPQMRKTGSTASVAARADEVNKMVKEYMSEIDRLRAALAAETQAAALAREQAAQTAVENEGCVAVGTRGGVCATVCRARTAGVTYVQPLPTHLLDLR